MTISATYDPADDKIRMRSDTRLDPTTYAKVKAAGFGWAPKQGCFFAVWKPEREDLARELSGSELEDEDTTLAERAEARAERFENYHEKRAADSERAAEAVSAIADNIPLGQPILVGHHSEKHARRDAKRIENGMRKAVDLWKTAEYWQRRARGVLSHAERKERPEVRANRIKTLEADARRWERRREAAEKFRTVWIKIEAPDSLKRKDGTPTTLQDRAGYPANVDPGLPVNFYSDLRNGTLTAEAARDQAIAHHADRIANCDRWLEHLTNRLSYERALLGASGFTPPAKKPGKAALPLLNLRGRVAYRHGCTSVSTEECTTVEMTKAEFAAIHDDYKGTRVSADGTHRLRYICRLNGQYCRAIVFLTDSKEHERPSQETVEARAAEEDSAKDAAMQKQLEHMKAMRESQRGRTHVVKAPGVEAIEAALKAGVRVAVAPNLFPTPPELARRMANLADPLTLGGKRVLEPSAGTGNLIRAAIDSATGADNLKIVAIEINPQVIWKLWQQRQLTIGANESNFRVEQGDFLQYNPDDKEGAPWGLGYFHAVLMNPPFDHGTDIDHIKHALEFLKPGGRLVAICANGPRQQAELKPLATTWEELPDDTFKASGTRVRTVLLTIDK